MLLPKLFEDTGHLGQDWVEFPGLATIRPMLESWLKAQSPVTLHYETRGEPWAPAWTICWWGGMGLRLHVWRFLRSRGAVATVRWAPEPVVENERKSLAARVHAELAQRFRPIRREPPPPDFPWPELLGNPAEGP